MRSGFRPKEHKLVKCRRLHDEVNRRLKVKWSPEQISARLVVAHAGDAEMRVSYERIYQSLYLQARGVLRTELTLALRQGGPSVSAGLGCRVARGRSAAW